jgi:hypothetical protein
MLTFIRGGSFGDSALRGQVYVKILPKGEAVQLTRDEFNKEQPAFSPDGSRIVYTSVLPGFKMGLVAGSGSWRFTEAFSAKCFRTCLA